MMASVTLATIIILHSQLCNMTMDSVMIPETADARQERQLHAAMIIQFSEILDIALSGDFLYNFYWNIFSSHAFHYTCIDASDRIFDCCLFRSSAPTTPV